MSGSMQSGLEGIDVSHHQGVIDWAQVAAAGKTFAFMKATEGTDFIDPRFAANWKESNAAGLLRGAYHYYRPSMDAADQAKHFLANADLAAGDLLPVLDAETTDGVAATEIVTGLQVWLDQVAAATGARPFVNTNRDFWASVGSDQFGAYPLWASNYDVRTPTLPIGWSRCVIWQYSQTGTVSGIDGNVDLNRSEGTREALEAFTIPS